MPRVDPYRDYLPGRDRRNHPGRVLRVHRLRLQRRPDRVPRGRRGADGPQAARPDQVYEHHPQVGADRLARPLRLVHGHHQGQDRAQERQHRPDGHRRPTEKVRWNFFDGWPTKWTARTSTPRAPRWRSRRSRSPTKDSSGRNAVIQTEHEFTLPVGYQDEDGTLHRDGVMRLATAADEILPLRDPRVQANEAYLIVILLSRVITRLGGGDAGQPEGHREPVRGGPRVPAGVLQPAQPDRRRATCRRRARTANTNSRWSSAAWGDSRLPPRGAARGGGLRRLSLPLAARRHAGTRARRAAALGGGDLVDQPAHERGSQLHAADCSTSCGAGGGPARGHCGRRAGTRWARALAARCGTSLERPGRTWSGVGAAVPVDARSSGTGSPLSVAAHIRLRGGPDR